MTVEAAYLSVQTGEAVIAGLAGRGLGWLVGLVQLEQDHHQHQGQADCDHHRYPQQHRGSFLLLEIILYQHYWFLIDKIPQ